MVPKLPNTDAASASSSCSRLFSRPTCTHKRPHIIPTTGIFIINTYMQQTRISFKPSVKDEDPNEKRLESGMQKARCPIIMLRVYVDLMYAPPTCATAPQSRSRRCPLRQSAALSRRECSSPAMRAQQSSLSGLSDPTAGLKEACLGNSGCLSYSIYRSDARFEVVASSAVTTGTRPASRMVARRVDGRII